MRRLYYMISQKVFIKASRPTAEAEHKQNRGIYFFSLQLLLAGLHSLLSRVLSVCVTQIKSLLNYLFWLNEMWLRGTLDICGWPAFQRWPSKQKWQVNCWFLFHRRKKASLCRALWKVTGALSPSLCLLPLHTKTKVVLWHQCTV